MRRLPAPARAWPVFSATCRRTAPSPPRIYTATWWSTASCRRATWGKPNGHNSRKGVRGSIRQQDRQSVSSPGTLRRMPGTRHGELGPPVRSLARLSREHPRSVGTSPGAPNVRRRPTAASDRDVHRKRSGLSRSVLDECKEHRGSCTRSDLGRRVWQRPQDLVRPVCVLGEDAARSALDAPEGSVSGREGPCGESRRPMPVAATSGRGPATGASSKTCFQEHLRPGELGPHLRRPRRPRRTRRRQQSQP